MKAKTNKNKTTDLVTKQALTPEVMPAVAKGKAKTEVPAIPTASALESIKALWASRSAAMKEQVSALEIKDNSVFLQADVVRGQLTSTLDEIDATIKAPMITPIHRALTSIRAVYNAVREPFEKTLESLDKKMKAYKQAEIAKLEEENRKKQAEIDRLNREAQLAKEEAERLAAQTSAAAQAKAQELEAKSEYLADQAMVQEYTSAASPVRGANTGYAKVRKYRVKSIELLLLGVTDGSNVPADLFSVNAGKLQEYWRANQALVEEWPGIEVYDDLQPRRS